MAVKKRTTVRILNIPLTAVAKELFDFFETLLGKGTVFAIEIYSEHKNWKSKGKGRVQFETLDEVDKVNLLFDQSKLVFQNTQLEISPSLQDIIVRPNDVCNRSMIGDLHVGFLSKVDCLNVLETWENVKVEVLPERKRVEFWVSVSEETYKLEIQFDDILATSGWILEGEETNALLLQLHYAPNIYRKVCGPSLASKFSVDRYHMYKENFEFLWVRTTGFSMSKSIGHSSSFCWRLGKGLQALEILASFPHCNGQSGYLSLITQDHFGISSEIGPLIKCPSEVNYEIIFQLNALVQSQKISLASITDDLITMLNSLSLDSAIMILRKLHMVESTCYEPIYFVQSQIDHFGKKSKHLLSLSESWLEKKNLMACHRVLITPTKVYFTGPEVETANYVVKHYAKYASDFLRLTFVEEDLSVLPADAVSITIRQGLFSNPCRTPIYDRILSILSDGIEIGSKRFEFLAFSASQLRSSSVWMFASNDAVKADNIREWMGSFKEIRNVSKCAARMGQLFSSSHQTVTVPSHDVVNIPDIEVTTDGITYCFSDGIGKISSRFAKQVAKMCGYDTTPSAFQIRYGGYKGVVAVDHKSFRKLSLRPSMRKFDSNNIMLNVASCSKLLPCYLNREIIILLSTLGIEDEKFEAMLHEQICLLHKMLSNKEAARNVLAGMGDTNGILDKMLLLGYDPSREPYLHVMLKAHRDYQLSDIRSKCRLFVPKGRVLMGCLDETGILSYGQVFVRVSMTSVELQCGDHNFFRKDDDGTAVVVGKVVVTKNPCLHPGDIRVLEAVFEPAFQGRDCLVFPQKGERPHSNECSGGDLDGDLFFVSWDENLIPTHTDTPMDYIARRPRILDHVVTLEEIQKFFVDYMISDNLGMISIAHLIHADREPEKARSPKCLQLATLHSMAVDFAKNGAPAEMPNVLRPNEFPDFMEKEGKATYESPGIIGKLYRATMASTKNQNPDLILSEEVAKAAYDPELEVDGFEDFLEKAQSHKTLYIEKLSFLMNYYGADSEDEILTGNLRNRSMYLEHERRKYRDVKEKITKQVECLNEEVREWFNKSCEEHEHTKMASAWYHVAYHPTYNQDSAKVFFSFPWIVGDILLNIKSGRQQVCNI
ncbi:RNA-dependent RNA polymerase [Thalictrum thalictroides]|uniref:RNA-dependent RNA polymerase n=1 Tax=Thalictrum thalictroides TaxID=46969 RepID=A0A7J6W6W7_THATH|nr:RNA-dependent RNA polymerase [Thalictrum thalictroides]